MNLAPRISAVLASSLFLSSALAQEAGKAVREQAEAVLVEVPVRVLDKNGSPIRDLRTADFTLYDDGHKQTVVGFDAIDLADKAVSGNPNDPVPPAARRRFLILFDFSFARPKAVLAARRAAKEFVLSGLGERDLAAVATYSVERGIQLLVTFSSDRVQLARAIDTLGIEAEREHSDPLAFAFDTTFLKASLGTGNSKTEARAAAMIESLETLSQVAKARNDDYERGRVRSLIQSFDGLARGLASVEGRKDIIYLSEGFRGRFLVGTKDTEQEREWLLSGEFWKLDSDKRYGNTPLRADVAEMGALFRQTDCVIHAVDIAGIRSDSDPGGTEDVSIGERQSENSLFELASSTGGEVFRNANDLTGQLGRLRTQLDLVYVLAYRPDRWGEEGRYHELKVKVARSGARVVARAGYFERRSFRRQTPLERNLSAADVIANETPVHDIPAQVLATPFAGGDGEASVPVLLEIPGRALVEGEKGDRATAEVYVYAVDAENHLRDFFTQVITLDLTKNVEKLYSGGLKFWGELRLPPGAYRVRALVRNADTGRMGLDVLPLRVPAFSPGKPYLLPPVFLESDGDWLVLRSRSRATGTPDSAWSGIGGDGVSPVAMPRARPGNPLRLCLVAYHFAPEGPGLKIGSQILDAEGRPLGGGDLSVLGKSANEPDGRRMVLLSLKTPDGLAPGQYGLRILIQDSVTGEARQASAPFVVQ